MAERSSGLAKPLLRGVLDELFHALTILAASCQYVAIAFFVIRVG